MSTPSNVVIRHDREKVKGCEEENRPDFIQFLYAASADELRLFVGYLKEKDPHNTLIPLFDRLIKATEREDRLFAGLSR